MMGKVEVISVVDSSLRFFLEPLRVFKPEYEACTFIELRHSKSNLIQLGEMVCKPRRIEVWPSGKCRLWYSEPKGKSFSSIQWALEIQKNDGILDLISGRPAPDPEQPVTTFDGTISFRKILQLDTRNKI